MFKFFPAVCRGLSSPTESNPHPIYGVLATGLPEKPLFLMSLLSLLACMVLLLQPPNSWFL